ncbi:2-isopropylmalate synthase, partial [Bacillus cereus group sp. N21]|nr:2-isopropylmalate synthase [Bacillus cereus group sp. N21]
RVRNIQQTCIERKGPRLSKSHRLSKPYVKGASERLYHRDGPGERWVQRDYRTDERASFYGIQRVFYGAHMDDNLEG